MKNNNRPIIKPPTTSREQLWDKLTLALGLAMVLIPAIYYGQLPDEIPTHFNGRGEADGWGSKNTVWLLPLIGLVVLIPMTYLYRMPHKYNYLKKITPENAAYEYQRAREMVRLVNLSVAFVFCLIVYQICNTAMHPDIGPAKWMLPLILLATMVPIVWYFMGSKAKD